MALRPEPVAPPDPDPPPPAPRTPKTTPAAIAPPTPDADTPPAPWPGPIVEPAAEPIGAVGPPLIERPRWRARPADLGRYYPRRAETAGREGVVELECMVRVTGRLDCAVAQETPQGWGFGQAALAIARDHNMAPAMRDGAAIEARYRMRVPFNLD
ncbi:MAG: TonB family protein [Alphaproteobacteria bacterium]|nr:TonB family protein [Alphaproteobacteria bacterium]